MPIIQTQEVGIYYEESGAGTPLLFVSGTGWSGAHWTLFQTPYFSPKFRTIVFDHRGTGRSDKPETAYSTRQFAHDAVALLDALGIDAPAHIVGHSMGGRVAQWIALDAPERVRSLVLVASGPGQIDPRAPFTRGIPVTTAAEMVALGWSGYMDAHLRDRFMFLQPQPDLVERFVATHRGQFGTDLKSYLRHVEARQQHQTADRLDDISVPTLVIVGADDIIAAGMMSHVESSRYLAEHIPHAIYMEIPNAAHAVFIEQSAAFNAALAQFFAAH